MRGVTHAGVRWNTVSAAADFASSGTICADEQPVPTTPTRLPASGTSARHAPEWKDAPAKDAAPGSAGVHGVESAPGPAMTKRARSTSAAPSARRTATAHTDAASSHVADSTLVRVRSRAPRPSAAETDSMYARISGAVEKRRVHDALSAQENEYQCDGTSHAAPGYVFHSHVPPTPGPFSSSTRRSDGSAFRR